MSVLNNNLKQFAKASNIADAIIGECNDATIIALTKTQFSFTKKVEGVVNKNLFDKYKKDMDKQIAASLYTHLLSAGMTQTQNRFDASSYQKPEYDAFSVGQSTLSFFSGESEPVVHQCAVNTIGKFSPYVALANTVGMVISTSNNGNSPNFSSDNTSTISAAAKVFFSSTFDGVLNDDSPESKNRFVKEMQKEKPKDKAKVFSAYQSHIPIVNNKKILEFTYDPSSNAFSNIKGQNYTNSTYDFLEGYKTLSQRLNAHTSGCTSRRFLIHSINSWVGAPVNATWMREIIMFYEAGVRKGDRVLFLTKSQSLISILRLTFGVEVYGIGIKDCMISKAEAKGRSWDYVFSEDHIKAPNGKFSECYPDLYRQFVALASEMGEFNGRHVVHVTPLLFYSTQFWNSYRSDNRKEEVKRPANGWIKVDNNSYANYNDQYPSAKVQMRKKSQFKVAQSYTLVEPVDIEGFRGNFFTDPYCIEGVMGFILNAEGGRRFSEVLGDLLIKTKRLHLALYYPSHIQFNKYYVKLGKKIDFDYVDDYSMAFS